MFPLVVSQCRKQQRRIEHQRAERALSPPPFTPPPLCSPFPSSRSNRAWKAVYTPDSLKPSLSLFSVSLSLWNPPLLLHPLPTSIFSRGTRKKMSGYWRGSASMALSQKRLCIQPTYGHVFQILSLFNQTHQSQANFLSCTVAGQKLHLRADA